MRMLIVNACADESCSAVSGYCFLTFSSPSHASSVLDHFESTQQRTLMPNSQRTFKRASAWLLSLCYDTDVR